MKITENTCYIQSRHDFEEEVNGIAYEYATCGEKVSKEQITQEMLIVLSDHARAFPELFVDKGKALEAIENYDYANYGIFSVSELIDSIYESMLTYQK